MARHGPEVWRRVKRAYETGEESLPAIAAREGVSLSGVHRHARAGRWRRRETGRRETERRARTTERLLLLSEDLTQALMREGADGGDDENGGRNDERDAAGFARIERRVRTLSSLVRSVQAIARLGDAEIGPAGEPESDAATDAERERLRAELERRLDRALEDG